MHLGAFLRGSVVQIPFNTFDADEVLVTFAGTPRLRTRNAATLAIIESDLVPSVDVNAVTGHHLCLIDTSDAEYAAITDVVVEVQAGTVDGVSRAGYFIREFSLNTGVLPDNAISAGAVATAAVAKVQSGLATSGALATASTAASAAQTAAEGVQTQVGVAGAGLTALGDTRLTNLDAAVSGAVTAAEAADAAADAAVSAADAAATAATAAAAAASALPSAATTATAVRTELGTELARVDVAVSTRLATDGYTAPPTAVQNADALLARNQKGGATGPAEQSVSAALAGGGANFTIVDGVLTVLNLDGTTAFTRTLTRAQLNAIISSVAAA